MEYVGNVQEYAFAGLWRKHVGIYEHEAYAGIGREYEGICKSRNMEDSRRNM